MTQDRKGREITGGGCNNDTGLQKGVDRSACSPSGQRKKPAVLFSSQGWKGNDVRRLHISALERIKRKSSPWKKDKRGQEANLTQTGRRGKRPVLRYESEVLNNDPAGYDRQSRTNQKGGGAPKKGRYVVQDSMTVD